MKYTFRLIVHTFIIVTKTRTLEYKAIVRQRPANLYKSIVHFYILLNINKSNKRSNIVLHNGPFIIILTRRLLIQLFITVIISPTNP